MMPRPRYAWPALVVLGALTAMQLTGCTAIGFGVGALADMSSGKGTAGRLVTARTGTRVTMWLRDGRRLNGRFLGSRDSLSTSLPVRPIGGVGASAPLRAVLILDTQQGVQQIPVQDVTRVSVPVARGKVIGLVSGLAVDGVMIFAIVSSLEGIGLGP